MAGTERLLDFPAKATPVSADIVYVGDSADNYEEVQCTIGDIIVGYSAALASIAGLTTSADQMIYTTGSNTYAVTSAFSYGRSLLASADASSARSTLGLVIGADVEAYSAALNSIAGLTTLADQMIYLTAANTYATTSATSYGRSLLASADAAGARSTLGLVIGTNVQAYNAALASIAGLSTSADQMIYTTGSNTYATTSTTLFGRSLLNTADDNALRVLVGLPVLTNGQLYIGSTGADPVAANLTAGAGISISNSAGAITIAGTGSGIGWTEVTGTTQSMAYDNAYVTNNASLVTLTLPAIAPFGTVITIVGKGAGGWLVAQNASQQIRIGSSVSTAGVGGSIASTNQFDSIELVCTTANTIWTCIGGPQGNITVA